MAVNYSLTAINDRLLGVVTAIDSGGSNAVLRLLAGGTIVSTISLARPCGTVNGGVLTFSGTLLDPAAANTGNITAGRVESSDGATQISGLTAGIPLSGADIIISNGLNTTLITAGQVVSLTSAQITGS
jgi:hypothetical protein